MSKRSELETWIAAANAHIFATISLPLVTRVSTSGGTGTYEVNAPLVIIPQTGEILGRGERFRYIGVNTPAASTGEEWDSISRYMLIDVLDDLKRDPNLRQGGIMSRMVEENLEVSLFSIAEEPLEAPSEVVVEAPDFSSMTKKEIDAWASDHGIEVDGRLSKADMITFVEEALAA